METETMTPLTEFLRARIAEDEAEIAREEAERAAYMAQRPGASWAIPWFDPVRLRAECEAKRRIAELWLLWNKPETRGPNRGHLRTDGFASGARQELRTALIQLARIYADHPDFRQEWRA